MFSDLVAIEPTHLRPNDQTDRHQLIKWEENVFMIHSF